MEVLSPPPEEAVILSAPQSPWNTLLVVIDPTEIVEQSCCEISEHCRQGANTTHTAELLSFIDLTSHHTTHSVLAITFHIISSVTITVRSKVASAALFCDYDGQQSADGVAGTCN